MKSIARVLGPQPVVEPTWNEQVAERAGFLAVSDDEEHKNPHSDPILKAAWEEGAERARFNHRAL